MLIKIITSLITVATIGYANIASALAIPIPESLNGAALIVDVTETEVHDPAIHFPISHGQVRTYFSSSELFYDETSFSGWHFVIDYSMKKNSDNNSLIISTRLPASRSKSNLLTFRQTLMFTSKSAGTAIIEFYDKSKLAFSYKGTFLIEHQEFVINSGGLKDRKFNLTVDSLNKNSKLFPLNAGDKIEILFLDEKKIRLSIGCMKYIGKNEYFKQMSVSSVNLHGRFNNDTTYDLNLNYYDFNKGTMELSLAKDNSQLSGSFESHRYTAISSSPLKGEMIRGNSIYSQHTGIIYPYEIYLPPGYAASRKNNSVVYITDGQWETDLANVVDANKKNVILVFVDQGPDDRRAIDYQLPGAYAYIKFLKQELVPLIESKYRVNGNRSFFGASLGGLLGGILISQEKNKPFFKNYILADGAFWGIAPEIISNEIANYKENQMLPINILLTETLRGNFVYVDDYEHRFRNRNYKSIRIMNKIFPNLHDEMTGPTLANYINCIE